MENLNKISVHSIGFNLIKHKFDYKDALDNFYKFGDELVLCINCAPEEELDGTWEAVNDWKIINNAINLKLIQTNFSIKDPFWFGKLKDTALQNTKYNYKVLVDLDERLIPSSKEKWLYYGEKLQKSGGLGFLVPSIDLYGDLYSMRWDSEKSILFKWHVNLPGCFRGPVKRGILPNGKINYKITSTDELIDKDGNHIECHFLLPDEILKAGHHPNNLEPYLNFIKIQGIYAIHIGYLDLPYKAYMNREVWQPLHNEMTGNVEDGLPKNLHQMFKPTYKHGLPLWWE